MGDISNKYGPLLIFDDSKEELFRMRINQDPNTVAPQLYRKYDGIDGENDGDFFPFKSYLISCNDNKRDGNPLVCAEFKRKKCDSSLKNDVLRSFSNEKNPWQIQGEWFEGTNSNLD